MDRRKALRWAADAALLCGSVVFTLVALETGVRVLRLSDSRPTPPPIYRASDDPEIGYELKPSMAEKAFRNTVTTNALGFRSPERDGKPLVAILGDSIAFGYGVADGETLGARLQAELGEGVQVQDAAVPGYTVLQETATYEKKVAPLAPAALVLVFYWNDIVNMQNAVLTPNGNLVLPGEPADIRCSPVDEGILGLIPGRCWLDLHSALYRGIKKFVIARTGRARQAQVTEERKKTPDAEEAPPGNVAAYAETFRRLSRALPPDLRRIFVIWPDDRIHAAYRPKIRAMAEAEGFAVVDLHETFGNEAKTLSWDTVHPAPSTIATAASVIAKAVRGTGQLPTR